MALPYLMSNAGLLPGIAIIVAAFALSYVMHMLLAELSMGARQRADFPQRGRMRRSLRSLPMAPHLRCGDPSTPRFALRSG